MNNFTKVYTHTYCKPLDKFFLVTIFKISRIPSLKFNSMFTTCNKIYYYYYRHTYAYIEKYGVWNYILNVRTNFIAISKHVKMCLCQLFSIDEVICLSTQWSNILFEYGAMDSRLFITLGYVCISLKTSEPRLNILKVHRAKCKTFTINVCFNNWAFRLCLIAHIFL